MILRVPLLCKDAKCLTNMASQWKNLSSVTFLYFLQRRQNPLQKEKNEGTNEHSYRQIVNLKLSWNPWRREKSQMVEFIVCFPYNATPIPWKTPRLQGYYVPWLLLLFFYFFEFIHKNVAQSENRNVWQWPLESAQQGFSFNYLHVLLLGLKQLTGFYTLSLKSHGPSCQTNNLKCCIFTLFHVSQYYWYNCWVCYFCF